MAPPHVLLPLSQGQGEVLLHETNDIIKTRSTFNLSHERAPGITSVLKFSISVLEEGKKEWKGKFLPLQ